MKKKINKVSYIKSISRKLMKIKPTIVYKNKNQYYRHKQKLTILPAWYYKKNEDIE